MFRIRSSDWKIISLRYFNPIGAHPSGLIGESPLEPQIIFFHIYVELHLVFMKNYIFLVTTGLQKDGTCIRDFHVVDLAEAHVWL